MRAQDALGGGERKHPERGRRTHSAGEKDASARADTGTKEHPPPARSGQLKTLDSNESSSGEQALAVELSKASSCTTKDDGLE